MTTTKNSVILKENVRNLNICFNLIVLLADFFKNITRIYMQFDFILRRTPNTLLLNLSEKICKSVLGLFKTGRSHRMACYKLYMPPHISGMWRNPLLWTSTLIVPPTPLSPQLWMWELIAVIYNGKD